MKNPIRIECQLEVHGAPISKKDINQKFLRSLPPSWNQIDLIMRNKPDIDEIDIDDLYNNLRVYKDEMKRSSSSTSTFRTWHFFPLRTLAVLINAALSFATTNNPILNLKMWIFSRLMKLTRKDWILDGIFRRKLKGQKILIGDVTIGQGAIHQQINLHHRHLWLRWSSEAMTG
ncbi:hypothetical protein Tco_0499155 [Tanacetum coccineum]